MRKEISGLAFALALASAMPAHAQNCGWYNTFLPQFLTGQVVQVGVSGPDSQTGLLGGGVVVQRYQNPYMVNIMVYGYYENSPEEPMRVAVFVPLNDKGLLTFDRHAVVAQAPSQVLSVASYVNAFEMAVTHTNQQISTAKRCLGLAKN